MGDRLDEKADEFAKSVLSYWKPAENERGFEEIKSVARIAYRAGYRAGLAEGEAASTRRETPKDVF